MTIINIMEGSKDRYLRLLYWQVTEVCFEVQTIWEYIRWIRCKWRGLSWESGKWEVGGELWVRSNLLRMQGVCIMNVQHESVKGMMKGLIKLFSSSLAILKKWRIVGLVKGVYDGEHKGSRPLGRLENRWIDSRNDWLKKMEWMLGKQGECCIKGMNGGGL